ncbi:MAG: adenylate/guanylate cyclase domain-containing protein [Alphaproteobacteria bacterium]|nr:adenylate/guanylate cyclase domain-containing protein [Alphaproteobacteria bacterium]
MTTVRTKYADAGDIQIAYQVHGTRDEVLFVVPGLISHIELQWELPEYRQWLNALAEYFKVIVFDKRGQGLSDRSAGVPGPEQRMDDITAIAVAEGIERFSLFGYSEGATIAILYAASFPDRVKSIAAFAGFARFSNCDDYPHMHEAEDLLKMVEHWGSGGFGYAVIPEKMPEARELMGRLERACATPNAFRAMLETNFKIDIRAVLPEIRTPVLVMHCRDDVGVPVANGRYIADHLPNAQYIEFPHGGHMPWLSANADVVDAVSRFMLEDDESNEIKQSSQTYLSTVLFTDIVSSSEQLAELGDQAWRQKLDEHDRLAKREIELHQGRMVKHTGDGLLVTFDGPARAIRCAKALTTPIAALGMEIRCGLHIGEVEPRGGDITGLAVHVAARVMDQASPGETLITRTLHDLTAGAGLNFVDCGQFDLKGLPEPWQLYRVP